MRPNRGLEFSVAKKGLSIGNTTKPESKHLHLRQTGSQFQFGENEDVQIFVRPTASTEWFHQNRIELGTQLQ
jgi:hypothetical protein